MNCKDKKIMATLLQNFNKNVDFSDAVCIFEDDESEKYDEDLLKILSYKTRRQLINIIKKNCVIPTNMTLALLTRDQLYGIIIYEGLM